MYAAVVGSPTFPWQPYWRRPLPVVVLDAGFIARCDDWNWTWLCDTQIEITAAAPTQYHRAKTIEETPLYNVFNEILQLVEKGKIFDNINIALL
jgi:hypothetical protein